MPPKATPDAAPSQDIKILIELIRTATEFKADTSQMAAICGLTAAKNVPRKINSIIGPFGFELKSGRVVSKDGGSDSDQGKKSIDEPKKVPKAPKTPKAPKSQKVTKTPKTNSPKKRKIEELEREGNAAAAVEDNGMEVDDVKVDDEVVNGQADKE